MCGDRYNLGIANDLKMPDFYGKLKGLLLTFSTDLDLSKSGSELSSSI